MEYMVYNNDDIYIDINNVNNHEYDIICFAMLEQMMVIENKINNMYINMALYTGCVLTGIYYVCH
jgi:hypothetical protein